jgi:hypothetical protein
MAKTVPVDNGFKKKFTETPDQISAEELAELKKRMDEETDKMEADLRFMRVRREYYETAALIGMINVKNVPGLLGWELQRRFIESTGIVYQYEMGQKAAREEAEKKEAEEKKPTIITDGQIK